ncbi:YceI family protein [Mucilaginibacter antarcticus]|uniref:YceI family protein n=1 Tax=Mucilaginibacter antarcticus TaxID=1855725 RepID=A0ABW5XJI9_9SPHI
MKRIVILILPLLILATAASAQKVVILKTSIKFQLKNLGVNTGGSINGLQASMVFNPENLDASAIEAILDVNSINTDNDLRDSHLRGEEYFDVAKYPTITMKSVSLKHKSGDKYTGQFSLTIKDKTKTFEVPFTYTTDPSNTATFKGGLKLNRLDFGIGGKSLVMGNEVSVAIEVQVAK